MRIEIRWWDEIEGSICQGLRLVAILFVNTFADLKR